MALSHPETQVSCFLLSEQLTACLRTFPPSSQFLVPREGLPCQLIPISVNSSVHVQQRGTQPHLIQYITKKPPAMFLIHGWDLSWNIQAVNYVVLFFWFINIPERSICCVVLLPLRWKIRKAWFSSINFSLPVCFAFLFNLCRFSIFKELYKLSQFSVLQRELPKTDTVDHFRLCILLFHVHDMHVCTTPCTHIGFSVYASHCPIFVCMLHEAFLLLVQFYKCCHIVHTPKSCCQNSFLPPAEWSETYWKGLEWKDESFSFQMIPRWPCMAVGETNEMVWELDCLPGPPKYFCLHLCIVCIDKIISYCVFSANSFWYNLG